MEKIKLLKRVRIILVFFISCLFISGITAIPIELELKILLDVFNSINISGVLIDWVIIVYEGIKITNSTYPFMAYGYDWLAFAHIVLAILFIGPLRNPKKNIWVIEFGMIACVLVIPLALIAGYYREIPVFHRLIDCAFGVFGIIPLYLCYRYIKRL